MPITFLNKPADLLKYEIVVVGSGPGGATAASILAEGGREVLLLEEGPLLDREKCKPFSLDEMIQGYRNRGMTFAFGNPKVQYAEGRCVGGGSEINSGLYHRLPPEVAELWRKKFGVEGLSESELIPHFEVCEKDLSVSLLPDSPPVASAKLDIGAKKLGWKVVEVPRWYDYGKGTSGQQGFQKIRQTMSRTYIPRACDAGADLLSSTRVERLRRDGNKWVLNTKYANGEANQKDIKIIAENVFLACGAIQTAHLLRKSGIKNNIGNSLRFHPTIKLTAQFDEKVNSGEITIPMHQVKEFSPKLSFGGSISSPPHLALNLMDQSGNRKKIENIWENMAVFYAMIETPSYGKIRHIPGYRDPLVQYRLSRQDMRALKDGLENLGLLLFESGAKTIFPSVANWMIFNKREELKKLPDCLPRNIANLMTVHLFSSCPMGENKKICATDSFGKVHGFENLYIADASLLCTAPGVNPQGTIMGIVRRNTLKFLNKL
ncbi:GMC family oxidoreductase [Nitrospinaceae bacterium]|nr:GMC family oxidoreductase [Nitrospinaceae bacterium]